MGYVLKFGEINEYIIVIVKRTELRVLHLDTQCLAFLSLSW